MVASTSGSDRQPTSAQHNYAAKMNERRSSTWLALGAIALWGGLAPIGVQLEHVPPFLLTGLGLLIGSAISLPFSGWRLASWRVPLRTLALGVYGLFGFHFLLFIALRNAPPVQANLVNYLWPLGIVLLSPLFLPNVRLQAHHVLAAILGFTGASLAITGGQNLVWAPQGTFAWGYLPALGSAFIWASYSLWTRRVPAFPTSAIGLFGLVSGLLALACHFVLEPAVQLNLHEDLLLIAMGIGPLGAAFYLWDAALKAGDARRIGVLAFLTPLLSTLGLLLIREQWPDLSVLAATALIIAAAFIGSLNRH